MKNIIIVILVAIAVFLILLNLDSCRKSNRLQSDYDDIKGYEDTAMYYRDANGDLVTANESLEVGEKALLAAVDGLKEELKAQKIKTIKALTKVRTETRIDTIRIGLTDTVAGPDFNVGFAIDSPFYKIDGRVTNNNIMLNRVLFPDTQQIIVGTTGGLFKKKQSLVTIKHANPYIRTIGIQNYTIRHTLKWYEKPWVWGIAGFGAGFFASQKIK